jgi:hypothetical protein
MKFKMKFLRQRTKTRIYKAYMVVFKSSDYRLLADQTCKRCHGIGNVGMNIKSKKAVHCKCLIFIRFPIDYILIFDK